MSYIIFILALLITISTTCHYSCSTCTDQLYTSCLSCLDPYKFTVVKDPATLPVQYWSSVYQTGTCIESLAKGANALGVLLFLIVVGVCLLLRTKESFYLLVTLQTYGLYNLVEIAWVNPIGYVLQALQYFMIFNTMGSNYKTDDFVLNVRGNFRLYSFMKQTSLGPNIAIIAAFTLISLILLIIICIISVRRKKQAEPQKQIIFQAMLNKSEGEKEVSARESPQDPKNQCCGCWKWFSQQVLIQIAKFIICVIYFMIQETILVLLISLVYITPVNGGLIVLCIIYLHILVFVMSFAYYYRVQYFKDKKVMYISFAKKIILPVMVVIPIKYQYLFFVFAGVIWAIELVIDIYNGLYKNINRLAVYKVSETLTILLLIIYQIVETSGQASSSSKAASIACTFVICINLFFICVETTIAIKERYFNNQQKNGVQNQMKELKHESTMENIDNKLATIEIVDIQSSQIDEDNQSEDKNYQQTKEQNKNIKEENNTSLNRQSIATKPAVDEPVVVVAPEPPKKKRRKQILDKQLRLRYGI